MTLSAKHIQVRDFILAYQAEHGRRPQHKDIMQSTGIKLAMTVSRYIRRLEKAGELSLVYTRPADKARAAHNS